MTSPTILCLLALATGFQEPEGEPPLSLRVNRAIARGVEHLRGHQEPDGRWLGDETRYPGGLTAFVAYALKKSGVRRNDESLAHALEALASIEPRSTYGTSARLLLYESLHEPDAWRERARTCLDFLVETQTEGLWAYPEGAVDLSNVQFALMGLWSARGLGLEVPTDTLASCARAIWRYQEKDGGFHYRPDVPVTTGMTAGTLCGIELLRRLGEGHSDVLGSLRKEEKDRAAAEGWLARHWNPERNQWGPSSWTPGWHFAYLWAVQRLCELLGTEELEGHDWYAEGAEYLVREQHPDGGWGRKLEDACFALLFLRRTTFSGGTELAEIYQEIDAAARAAKAEGPALDPSAPRLADWLVAGPFLGKPGETGLADPPFHPARVRLQEGKKVARKRWERIELPEGVWTNLEELTGRGGDHCIWLLGTRLSNAGAESAEAILWFALEDGWRVFLDGEEVSASTRVQAPIELDVVVPVTLAPGEHTLLVIAEDALGAAAFGARVSGPDGKAPPAALSWGTEP